MSAVAELPDTGWLKDGALARLLSLLDRDGEEARVVGGAVRNALIRLPFDEVDIATTAVPDEVTRRAAAAGLKAIPTGAEHGTVTVVIDGKPFEVTTLRVDIETYGRKAKVSFGRDWAKDAARRDFTINALSVSADGKIHDYVGGLADIAAHKVRFIGEPAQRIAEDYLRILRFFRLHAWYAHGPPDAAGLHACVVARAGLETLSRERVRMELMKLLVAPRATPTLAVMAETGILGTVLGGVPLLASFENMAKVEAAIGAPADAVQRLGALGVATMEDAERLSERLRLSNAEFERLMALEYWWRVKPAAGEHAARVLLYQLGTKSFVDRALVAWSRSDAGAADAAWRQLATLAQRWIAPIFPLKAQDFLSRGVPKGPPMGAALRAAEQAWVDADFPDDRAAIEAIAERAAQDNKISG
ncbi:MAG TPA: CCA tRNA nucleotidyltransferase [Xanthobacteraceae bacterium]|nr:CCA tRNA nucleotidyltransferase [Xanthobacteraceae bacterium]